MNETFTVKFWGVRGSHPAPGPHTVHFGGNTACVEVRAGEHTIILDAGTGIIPLGQDLARRAHAGQHNEHLVLLFSHLHHDHTQGLPFFGPAYNPATRLHLFGPGASRQALQKVLSRNQMPPSFPVTLKDMGGITAIRSLKESDLLALTAAEPLIVSAADPVGPVIRIMKSLAHPGGVYIYRIEWGELSLVYATDTEGYVGGDQRLAAFARNATLLIHDAQYSQADYARRQGFGHSTAAMACELAAAAGAKQLALFHHDPAYDDRTIHTLQQQTREIFKNCFAAREGLEVRLTAGSPARPVYEQEPQSLGSQAVHG